MKLTAQKREVIGKKVKALRSQGLIPAELYGHGVENIHLSVPAKEFSKIFKQTGESTIIKISIENDSKAKEFNVLVHDIEKNHLTDEISHVDFYSVKMDEKIKTKIPLEFVGEAPAVKEKSGMLVKAMHEIEIEALPADLIHHIQIDVSSIADIGNSVLVKDIKPIKGVKFLVGPETPVATVVELAQEEVEAPAISVEDVKVETEEKKKERQESKESAE